MMKLDLTTSYPRSVRDKIQGVVMLPRTIDKGIAFANGKVGEYHYDCPMDKGVLGFLNIDANALLDAIKKANSHDEIVAFVKPYIDKKSAAEIAAFNDGFLASKPEPGSDSEKGFLNLRNQVAPQRTDVTVWADLLDLDEKRTVPERVAA
jgi:hypothetical protein